MSWPMSNGFSRFSSDNFSGNAPHRQAHDPGDMIKVFVDAQADNFFVANGVLKGKLTRKGITLPELELESAKMFLGQPLNGSALYQALFQHHQAKKAEDEDKLSIAEAENIAEEARLEIDAILIDIFVIAPIGGADDRATNFKSLYTKDPVYTGVNQDGQHTFRSKATFLCPDMTDFSKLKPIILRELINKHEANPTQYPDFERIREVWMTYSGRLKNHLSRLGSDYKDAILKGVERLMNGEGGCRSAYMRKPIPNLSWDPTVIPKYVIPAIRTHHCNTWNSFLRRCNDPLMVCCWFARLFTPGDSGRQALILHGQGKTGSSTIINALEEVLGYLCRKLSEETNQFTGVMLAEAMLGIMPDTSRSSYLMSDDFKRRTGGDSIYSEQKNGSSGNVNIGCKVLITTNRKLYVNPLQLWSMSRSIIVEVQPIQTTSIQPSREIVSQLVEEFPLFINECLRVSSEYCSKHAQNPVDIPMTKRTAVSMYSSWDSYSTALYEWVVSGEVTKEEPYAVYDSLSDTTELHNCLSVEEIEKAVDKLLKHIHESKRAGMATQFEDAVKAFIPERLHIDHVHAKLYTKEGKVTKSNFIFPHLKLKPFNPNGMGIDVISTIDGVEPHLTGDYKVYLGYAKSGHREHAQQNKEPAPMPVINEDIFG